MKEIYSSMENKEIQSSQWILFLADPRRSYCLALSLTTSLTGSLVLLRLDWCVADFWRCQPKIFLFDIPAEVENNWRQLTAFQKFGETFQFVGQSMELAWSDRYFCKSTQFVGGSVVPLAMFPRLLHRVSYFASDVQYLL